MASRFFEALEEDFFLRALRDDDMQEAMEQKPWLVDLGGVKSGRAVLGLDELVIPTNPNTDEERQKQYLLTIVSRSLYGAGERGQILVNKASLEDLRSRIPAELDAANQKALDNLPAKPKHFTRQTLASAYPRLSVSEQKLVWRLIETNPDNGDVSFLDLSEDNPALADIKSLQREGLLVELDPASPAFQASVARCREASSTSPWLLGELDKMEAKGPRLAAPWRTSHCDEPIVNDLYFSHTAPGRPYIPTAPLLRPSLYQNKRPARL